MDKRARAHHAERLLSDDVLEARLMFFALEQVKANLRSYVTDGKILEAKDQHRVID